MSKSKDAVPGSQQQVVQRLQRLHTSICLLESACAILEQSTRDGAVDLHQKTSRWCKQIRSEQQSLVKEMDSLNAELCSRSERAASAIG
jgi:hypothetical protein